MKKLCKHCGQEKELPEFVKCSANASGVASRCKSCWRAYISAHRKANPAWWRQKEREFKARYPEKVKAKKKRYAQRKKAHIRAYTKRYAALNKEKFAEYGRVWRKANQSRRLALHRAWRHKNHARWREIVASVKLTRRARERGAKGTCGVDQLAARVRFYGERCWICNRPYEAMDHVKPVSKGGSQWPANLRPICSSCNRKKGARWPFHPRMIAA